VIPVIVESPFAGADLAERARNKAYLERCLRWCVMHGFTPYASHKVLTDCLDDTSKAERELGIHAGLAMSVEILRGNQRASVLFFEDYGMSGGMTHAWSHYAAEFAERRERLCIGDLGTGDRANRLERIVTVCHSLENSDGILCPDTGPKVDTIRRIASGFE